MIAGLERTESNNQKMGNESRVSIENPVIPVSKFEREMVLKSFEPLIDAITPEILKLDMMMETAGVPLSNVRRERQQGLFHEFSSKILWMQSIIEFWNKSVSKDFPLDVIGTEVFDEIADQINEVSVEISSPRCESKAAVLKYFSVQIDTLQHQLNSYGFRQRGVTGERSYIQELRDLDGLLWKFEKQLLACEGQPRTNEAINRCQKLRKLTQLLLNRISYLTRNNEISEQIREQNTWLPSISNSVTRTDVEGKIEDKSQELLKLSSVFTEHSVVDPDVFTKKMVKLMRELGMSLAPLGFPGDLGDGVVFPLEERVGVIVNPAVGGSIDVFTRKPSGARKNLVGIYSGDYRFFRAMSDHPDNRDLLFRMIVKKSEILSMSDGLVAQGIVSLAHQETEEVGNQKEEKSGNGRHSAGKPSSHIHGPGRYTSNR